MDSELEALRKKRMMELMKANPDAQLAQQESQIKEAFKAIERDIRKHLDDKAYERLNNIKLINPELAQQVVYLLYQLKMAGRLPSKLKDNEFKQILNRLIPKKREPKIIRK
ncbi:MAG: hypothetical protein GXN99_02325 [Candidatus Nanohaloarchaeota archaeon]|nr:hypothetical protein [Candidatus Nanohaloarchaeota archaeon]